MTQTTQKPQLRDLIRRWAPLLALVLLAFALRTHRLGAPSLYGDEAFAAQFITLPPDEMLAGLTRYESQPPLYYTTLKLWRCLAGGGEFALRYVSVWWGTLTVPLIYALGRRLGGEKPGLAAALLATTNPYLVWHSQEARMYAMLAALAAASLALLVRAYQTGARRWWRAWAGALWLALLTHYFAAFFIAAQVLALIPASLRRKGRTIRFTDWGVPLAVIGLLYAPWVAYVGPAMASHEKSWIQPTTMGEIFRRLLLAFSLGATAADWAARWLTPFFALILIGGALTLLRQRSWTAGLLIACLLVPPVLVYLLSLLRPLFRERYLIFGLSPFLILIAAGATAWARRTRERGGSLATALAAAPLAFLVTASGASLANHFFDPDHAKSPPWRELVQHIQAQRQLGDAVIQNYPDPSLPYYLAGDPPHALVPQNPTDDEAAIAATLTGLTGAYRRLWLVPTRSPDWDAANRVQTWLNRHADLLDEQRFRDLRLRLYLSPSAFVVPGESLARLGETVRLRGYRLNPKDGSVAPGETLHLSLYWQTEAPLTTSYKTFVHLLGPAGQIAVQRDNPPAGGSYLTTAWQPGEVIVDGHELAIPADGPPGVYRLAVGLYDGATLDRLPVHSLTCKGCSVPAFVSDDRLFLPVDITIAGPTP